MKKWRYAKFLALLLCAVVIISSLPMPADAFERKDHDKYMSDVLFKNFKEVDNDPKASDKIDALECASYLCIDQFNNNGQGDLDTLIRFGVKGIPSSVSEISFSASGTTHRSYTHRGWDYNYGSTNEKWPARRQLLISTVNTIFDFEGNEKKAESFCALLYYTHVLGDHMDDTSYKVNNGLKMDAGGRKDKYDIIHELETHIAIVFEDQTHTHKYQSLMSTLEKYNSRLYKIVNSEGGINTDEEFALKMEYVEGLMKVITYYLPEMLKDEPFFYNAFYK